MESYSWKTIGSKWTSTVTQPNFPSSEKRFTDNSLDNTQLPSACILSPEHSLPQRQTISLVNSLADRCSSFNQGEILPSCNLPFGPHFVLWKYSLCLFSFSPDSLSNIWKSQVFLTASFLQVKHPCSFDHRPGCQYSTKS